MNDIPIQHCTSTLGIDIAKDKFDAAHKLANKRTRLDTFSNDSKGFRKLLTWCRRHGDSKCLLAVMEATGAYGDPLAEFLDQRDHRVSVENPVKIKNYGKSLLKRNKTDRSDAKLIADYADSTSPRQWHSPTPDERARHKLVRKYAFMVNKASSFKNCLKTMPDDPHLTRALKTMQQAIEEISQEIIKQVDADETLRQQARLIQSIKGFGKQTAAIICASVDLKRFSNGRQFAAYIGVSPRRLESGNWQGPTRMCKFGHAQLRSDFYMCALSVKRYNPGVQAFCERLRKKGLKEKQIIGAVMNKMARVVYAMVRDGKEFAPDILAGGLYDAS